VMADGIFDEWRLANRLAVAAEQAVFVASLGVIEGTCIPPSTADVDNAKRLRSLANDLFTVGMQNMADQAARLKR
jgi:hypothetical protein